MYQVGVGYGVVNHEIVGSLGGVYAQTSSCFVAKVASELFKDHSVRKGGSLVSLKDSNNVFDIDFRCVKRRPLSRVDKKDLFVVI